MKITFGIAAGTESTNYLDRLVRSILAQNIQHFEIIVVGATGYKNDNVKFIEFDEKLKPGWITKKKNLITENARYDLVVYMHDYLLLSSSWYEGLLGFGTEFDICMHQILNPDHSRARDWVLWPHNDHPIDKILVSSRECLIPYSCGLLTRFQYISGAYWLAKKSFMLRYPLNEDLCWGQGEDVEWSFRIRNEAVIRMNQWSTVFFQRAKHPEFKITTAAILDKLLFYTQDKCKDISTPI